MGDCVAPLLWASPTKLKLKLDQPVPPSFQRLQRLLLGLHLHAFSLRTLWFRLDIWHIACATPSPLSARLYLLSISYRIHSVSISMSSCHVSMSCVIVMSSCHTYNTKLIRLSMDNINMKQLTTIQSIKFYTYKQLLYLLIQFNIINYNQKNKLLIDYYETQCNTI